MALMVVRPGMLTTVQDRGRHGLQHLGVPVAGPMDWWSHDAANRLAGNDSTAATLEVTLIGPELEFTRSAIAVVVGAEFELSLSGQSVSMNQAFSVQAGARLTFGARRLGARTYVGVDGGVDVSVLMGSRATHVKGALGGFEGRALRRGDIVALGPPPAGRLPAGDPLRVPHLPLESITTLRAIAGPEAPDERFWSATFRVSPQSDRMGYRLEGASLAAAGDHVSGAVAMGTVQVTPSGTCVLLMADRATSGGYARAATVITADLPKAGQLAPGDSVRFVSVTAAEARHAADDMRALLPGGGR